jgi:hypothetical protein
MREPVSLPVIARDGTARLCSRGTLGCGPNVAGLESKMTIINGASQPKISTRNVTRVFRLATSAQVADGLAWYDAAHGIAYALGETYGIGTNRAAGVLAALSPLRSWGDNVNLATRFIIAGGLSEGAFKLSLDKAQAILDCDGDAATIRAILNGNKTVSFFEGIRANGMTDVVCIDRHAYDVVTNTRHTDETRPSLSGKRYATAADSYVRAARIISKESGLSISPAQVQAITWVAWRSRYWSDGAFDFKG